MRAEPGDPGSQSRESDDRIAATTSAAGAGGSVFVTVGTTRFDALVEVVDSRECRAALKQRGFTSVVVQRGRGTYKPAEGDPDSTGVTVTSFEFAPSMAPYIEQASLVISHAGSGSIFEALRASKPLVVAVNDQALPSVMLFSLPCCPAGSGSIFEALRASKRLVVVVNGALMDNHQRELAGALAARHHLVQAVPESLVATVRKMDLEGLLPYPPREAEKQHVVQAACGAGSMWWTQHLVEAAPGGGSTWWRQHLVEAAPGGGSTWCRQHLVEAAPGAGSTWWRQYLKEMDFEKDARALNEFLGFA
ncbi:unnamed protein product [Closterium sp. Naga37s-1]|nr:unnamed protein product [Closterium sp. Naga37s-1]